MVVHAREVERCYLGEGVAVMRAVPTDLSRQL
jgi:hypothetical protein